MENLNYSFSEWHRYVSYYYITIIYVTGPAKRDQVGTKYTISQNDKYLEIFAGPVTY